MGFCILLVVMFHAELLDKGTPCLGMLRMPFYFALSGLFFKDYGGFKTILKKINKLLIPFLFFYIINRVSTIFQVLSLFSSTIKNDTNIFELLFLIRYNENKELIRRTRKSEKEKLWRGACL